VLLLLQVALLLAGEGGGAASPAAVAGFLHRVAIAVSLPLAATRLAAALLPVLLLAVKRSPFVLSASGG